LDFEALFTKIVEEIHGGIGAPDMQARRDARDLVNEAELVGKLAWAIGTSIKVHYAGRNSPVKRLSRLIAEAIIQEVVSRQLGW